MAKKKKQWGGARPGSGAPKTGRNTKNIGFSVHKDIVDEVKAAVRAVVDKFKASQGQQVAAAPKKDPVDKVKANGRAPEKAPKRAATPAVNNFLENRRRSKKLTL